ncbi:MAG: CoA transferase [Chloroflexota bacterium]
MTSSLPESKCPVFKGLKTLCLGLSGTILLVNKFLAEHGATSIWVESATHVDIIRSSAPFYGGIVSPNRSATAVSQGGSQLSMGINLRKPGAAEVVKRLAAWADVIGASWAPGALEKRGLGYDDLRKVNPNAIIINGSALGRGGTHGNLAAFGWAQQSLAGQIEYVGWPDRPGVGPPIAYPDFSAPWVITTAVVAALDYRRRTGKGQFVEFSQLESTFEFTPAHLILQYTANRDIPTRQGNRASYAVPCGAFPCKGKDRWCAISVRNDAEWNGLCQTMSDQPWTKDARFGTFLGRRKHEDELETLIGTWTARFTPHDVMMKLQQAGVPAGAVQKYDEILDKDPQFKHRKFFMKMSRPELENISHFSWPARLTGTPPDCRVTPRLGEHTEAICHEILGMSDREFGQLVADEVLELGV